MDSNASPKGLICWDVDGVLIDEAPTAYDWRADLLPDARTLYQTLNTHEHWQSCLRGEMDVNQALNTLARDANLAPATVEHILKNWHGGHTLLNAPVISLLTQMKQQGWQTAIASNQDALRAKLVRALLPLEEIVDLWAFSCELNAAKPSPDFYTAVLKKAEAKGLPSVTGLPCVMIDDVADNLKAPNKMGWKTHHYTGLEGLNTFLKFS